VSDATKRRLFRRLRKVGLAPAPDVVDGLVVYYDLLRRWNEKINLTSLPDSDEAVDRLLVEPLVACRVHDVSGLVVDIGSGGGSPAIPLKLASPTISLWMVESKVRKAAFLREVVRQLALSGAVVESMRFEGLVTRSELFGRVDVISQRAVRADLKTLASLQQLLRPGGHLMFFSTRGAAEGLLLPPQFEVVGEELLIPSLQSALVLLRKRS
jgi:16S rRNA (guanine527-N7)-methyltransferase